MPSIPLVFLSLVGTTVFLYGNFILTGTYHRWMPTLLTERNARSERWLDEERFINKKRQEEDTSDTLFGSKDFNEALLTLGSHVIPLCALVLALLVWKWPSRGATSAQRPSSENQASCASSLHGDDPLERLETRFDRQRLDFSVRRKLFAIRRAQQGFIDSPPRSTLEENNKTIQNKSPVIQQRSPIKFPNRNNVQENVPLWKSKSENPNERPMLYQQLGLDHKLPYERTTINSIVNNVNKTAINTARSEILDSTKPATLNPIVNRILFKDSTATNNDNKPAQNPDNDPDINTARILSRVHTDDTIHAETKIFPDRTLARKLPFCQSKNLAQNLSKSPVRNLVAQNTSRSPTRNLAQNLPRKPVTNPALKPYILSRPVSPQNIGQNPINNPADNNYTPAIGRANLLAHKKENLQKDTLGPVNRACCCDSSPRVTSPKEAAPTNPHCPAPSRGDPHLTRGAHVMTLAEFAALPHRVIADQARYKVLGEMVLVWPRVGSLGEGGAGEGGYSLPSDIVKQQGIKTPEHQPLLTTPTSPPAHHHRATLTQATSRDDWIRTLAAAHEAPPSDEYPRPPAAFSDPQPQLKPMSPLAREKMLMKEQSGAKQDSGDEDTACMPPPPSGYHIRNDYSVSESPELKQLRFLSNANKVALNDVIIQGEMHVGPQQTTENDASSEKSPEVNVREKASPKKTKTKKRKASEPKSKKSPCKVLIIGKLNYHKNSEESLRHKVKRSPSFLDEKSGKSQSTKKSSVSVKKQRSPEKKATNEVFKRMKSRKVENDKVFPLSEKTVSKYYRPQSQKKPKTGNKKNEQQNASTRNNVSFQKQTRNKNQSALCDFLHSKRTSSNMAVFSKGATLNTNCNSNISQISDMFKPQISESESVVSGGLPAPFTGTPGARGTESAHDYYHILEEKGDYTSTKEQPPARKPTLNQLRSMKFGFRPPSKGGSNVSVASSRRSKGAESDSSGTNNEFLVASRKASLSEQSEPDVRPAIKLPAENLKSLEDIIISQIQQQKEKQSKIAEKIAEAKAKVFPQMTPPAEKKEVVPTCSNETLQLVSELPESRSPNKGGTIAESIIADATIPKNFIENESKKAEKSGSKQSLDVSSDKSKERLPQQVQVRNHLSNPLLSRRRSQNLVKRAKSCGSGTNPAIADKDQMQREKSQDRPKRKKWNFNLKQRIDLSSDTSIEQSLPKPLGNKRMSYSTMNKYSAVSAKRAKSCGSHSNSTSPDLNTDNQRKPKIKKRKQRQQKTPSPKLSPTKKLESPKSKRLPESKNTQIETRVTIVKWNDRFSSKANESEKTLSSRSRSNSPAKTRRKIKRSVILSKRVDSLRKQQLQSESPGSTSPTRAGRSSHCSTPNASSPERGSRAASMSPLLRSAIRGKQTVNKTAKKPTTFIKYVDKANKNKDPLFAPWRHDSKNSLTSNSSPLLARSASSKSKVHKTPSQDKTDKEKLAHDNNQVINHEEDTTQDEMDIKHLQSQQLTYSVRGGDDEETDATIKHDDETEFLKQCEPSTDNKIVRSVIFDDVIQVEFSPPHCVMNEGSVGDLSSATKVMTSGQSPPRGNKANSKTKKSSPGRAKSPALKTKSPVLNRKRRAKLIKKARPDLGEKQAQLEEKKNPKRRQKRDLKPEENQELQQESQEHDGEQQKKQLKPTSFVVEMKDGADDDTDTEGADYKPRKRPVWKRKKSSSSVEVAFARLTRNYEPKPLNSPRKRFIVAKFGSPVDCRQSIEGTSVDGEALNRWSGAFRSPTPERVVRRQVSPALSPYSMQRLTRRPREDTSHLNPSSDSDTLRNIEDIGYIGGDTELAAIQEVPSDEIQMPGTTSEKNIEKLPEQRVERVQDKGPQEKYEKASGPIGPQDHSSRPRSKVTLARRSLKKIPKAGAPAASKESVDSGKKTGPMLEAKQAPSELGKKPSNPRVNKAGGKVREARSRQRALKPAQDQSSNKSVPHWNRSPVRWDRTNVKPRKPSKKASAASIDRTSAAKSPSHQSLVLEEALRELRELKSNIEEVPEDKAPRKGIARGFFSRLLGEEL